MRPKEHYGALNTVMFSPEDLQLVKGEPALRRRFFDMQIAQTDPVYYDLLLKYNRVLQQRNRLLKELRDNGGTPDILQPWNEEFIRLAAAIVRRRLAALGKLQAIAGEIYSSITKGSEMLQVRYEQKANNSTLLYPQSAEEAAEDFTVNSCRSVSALIFCAVIRASVPTATICSFCSTVFHCGPSAHRGSSAAVLWH